jgi:hypothetical protein
MRSKDACPVREPGAGSKISLQGAVSDHALEFLLKIEMVRLDTLVFRLVTGSMPKAFAMAG